MIIIREIHKLNIIKDNLIESNTNILEASNQFKLCLDIIKDIIILRPKAMNIIGGVLVKPKVINKGIINIIIIRLFFLIKHHYLLYE